MKARFGELVSVIIPTYNRADQIRGSIDSVLQQTYHNLEVIIVDDGSTDGTFEKVNQWYQDCDRLIYVFNDGNYGVSASRNNGVRYAHGDMIAFQDSDDLWRPEKLEKQMEAFCTADDQTALNYCSMLRYYDNGEIEYWPPRMWPDEVKHGALFPFLLLNCLVDTPTMLLKKSAFWEAGGFNEELKALEDYEFTLRLSKLFNIQYIDEILFDGKIDQGINGNTEEKILSQCYVLEKYHDDLKQYGEIKQKLQSVMLEATVYGKRDIFYELMKNSVYCEYQEYADLMKKAEI